MAYHRMKLDYNNLIRQIDDLLGAENIEYVQNNAFGIGIGLELLSAYLKDIAKYAIETRNEYLVNWCLGLSIVKEDNDGKIN